MASSLEEALRTKRIKPGSVIALIYSPEKIEIARLLWADDTEMYFESITSETNTTFRDSLSMDTLRSNTLQYEYLGHMEKDEWRRFIEFMGFSTVRNKYKLAQLEARGIIPPQK